MKLMWKTKTKLIFAWTWKKGIVLDFNGSKHITYAELSSGRDKFTVCVRVSGGTQCKIECTMLVFRNGHRNYSTAGLPDDIPGICYRTQPKGWMDQKLFPAYFSEPRTIASIPEERTRHLCVDVCTAHNMTPELQDALSAINTNLVRFPSNCAHLIQPFDQLVLRSFKALFRRKMVKKAR